LHCGFFFSQTNYVIFLTKEIGFFFPGVNSTTFAIFLNFLKFFGHQKIKRKNPDYAIT